MMVLLYTKKQVKTIGIFTKNTGGGLAKNTEGRTVLWDNSPFGYYVTAGTVPGSDIVFWTIQ